MPHVIEFFFLYLPVYIVYQASAMGGQEATVVTDYIIITGHPGNYIRKSWFTHHSGKCIHVCMYVLQNGFYKRLVEMQEVR